MAPSGQPRSTQNRNACWRKLVILLRCLATARLGSSVPREGGNISDMDKATAFARACALFTLLGFNAGGIAKPIDLDAFFLRKKADKNLAVYDLLIHVLKAANVLPTAHGLTANDVANLFSTSRRHVCVLTERGRVALKIDAWPPCDPRAYAAMAANFATKAPHPRPSRAVEPLRAVDGPSRAVDDLTLHIGVAFSRAHVPASAATSPVMEQPEPEASGLTEPEGGDGLALSMGTDFTSRPTLLILQRMGDGLDLQL